MYLVEKWSANLWRANIRRFWPGKHPGWPCTQNLCPQQMLRERTNGETFVSATVCPQQCVLVCQGLNSAERTKCKTLLRPWQTRKHCWGHVVADTNVSGPRSPARATCVWDTKNVSDFVRKHFMSTTNVSPVCAAWKHNNHFVSRAFARPRNIMSNNVSAAMCPRLQGSLEERWKNQSVRFNLTSQGI